MRKTLRREMRPEDFAMINFKGGVAKAALVVLAAIVTHAPAAQGDPAVNFPNRPVRLIVGFAAGGGNDLVAYGKANPDKSNYATSSPAFTITTELFKLKTGMPAVAVPYKSSNEMMLSVAGGNTLFSIADGPPTVPLVQGGKIRALAVTGSERSSEFPDVPSMAEAGYPEVNIGLWSGLFVSAGTPPAVANKLGTESRRALADPGVRDKLKAMAVNPGGGPGEEFRKAIDSDIKVFADVVEAANLKFEE